MGKRLNELMKEIEKLSEVEKVELLKRLEEMTESPTESRTEYRIKSEPLIIKAGGIKNKNS